ncbi:hypothetical protein AK812_SmicGene40512, partial [Symbiodinium microadriaticum]
MVAPLDDGEINRGVSYDLGTAPLLPGSPHRSKPRREKQRFGGRPWVGVNVTAGLIMGGRDHSRGAPDWGAVGVNVTAGLIMGVREALGGIVSASMVFSSSDNPEISSMLQFGISMTLYTMSVGVLWYAVFGRLQLLGRLREAPEKIPATVFAIICTSSILSGLVSILFGKLQWATSMLMIPKPVVSGFLGAIGVVVLQAGLKTASGVPFHHFWPDMGWAEFCNSTDRLLQVACMMLHFICIRCGPGVCATLLDIERHPARKDAAAWPCGALSIWTTYSLSDVDLDTVWEICVSLDIVALVAMAILCTMLGALAITGRYPTGPAGDPAPDDPLDFNAELTTVGAVLCNQAINLSQLPAPRRLREDGGTHRIAVLTIALVAGSLFIFGFPIGSVVPKWFLGGLFMNTGWSFLKKTLMSYQSMSTFKWRGLHIVSMQYGISTCCVLMALYFSPTTAIMAGLCLSIVLFVWDGMSTSPVSSVVDGQHVVSRTKRPWWEMNVLAAEGDRVRLLYLQ